MTWGSAHPIGILLADASQYSPDGDSINITRTLAAGHSHRRAENSIDCDNSDREDSYFHFYSVDFTRSEYFQRKNTMPLISVLCFIEVENLS